MNPFAEDVKSAFTAIVSYGNLVCRSQSLSATVTEIVHRPQPLVMLSQNRKGARYCTWGCSFLRR
jgi:hypothetical protein